MSNEDKCRLLKKLCGMKYFPNKYSIEELAEYYKITAEEVIGMKNLGYLEVRNGRVSWTAKAEKHYRNISDTERSWTNSLIERI